MLEYKKQQEQEAAQKRKENEERSAKEMLERTKSTNRTNGSGRLEMSDQYKIKLEMIKRMFELLRQGKSLMDSGLATIGFQQCIGSAFSILPQSGYGKFLEFKRQ